MQKLKTLLRQPEFHAFLVGLGVIVFSYPLLIMSNGSRPEQVYLALFLPWGLIILLLFLTSRSYPVVLDEEKDQEEGDAPHA